MSLQENHWRRRRPTLSATPSFSLLSDEITVNYLARIPRVYYPRLLMVSKSFRLLLSSTELYAERSHIGSTEHCLYVSICDFHRFPQWFCLWINPKKKLASSSVIKKLLVPSPPTNVMNSKVVVVGSQIYVIGGDVNQAPSSVVRILDCRSHTWRDAPRMNVARKFPATCFYDGKIYVLGGLEDGKRREFKPWAEVFNTKTHNWEILPEPGTEIRKSLIYIIAEMEGKIYFDNNRGSVSTMYAYDPKQGKWEHCGNASEMFILSDCVIENVSYSCRYRYHGYYVPFRISWYDITVGTWKRVKGLKLFKVKHCKGEWGLSRLVSCGGKLLLVWEVNMRNEMKIRCAIIKVEKRDGGEVWGKVELDDVVLTVPTSRDLLDCLSVSV